MAEIFLSASIQVLFEKLLSPELISFVQHKLGVQVHSDVKKWQKMLRKIQAVLTDAEEQQITKASVKIWLEDLRDLAYDLEDVLDEFATEALRCQVMEEEPEPEPDQASTSKGLRSLIPTCCTSFKPSAVVFNVKMNSKIEEITSRLQDIVVQKSDLELTKNYAGGTSSDRAGERLANQLLTSSLPERHIYGREKDKEAIIKLLLGGSEASDDAEVRVIPIVGMGGIGKTTLAQLVYNDANVDSNFEMKAWVCVSQEFDVIRVTKEILHSFTSQNPSTVDNLNSLQVSLEKELFKKKFLLILDDVWHENYEDWTNLRKPLNAGGPGSTIIVTTRNQVVAETVGNYKPYTLSGLSNDDCLSLFTQHALGTRNFDSYPHLRQTGEEIVKKCKGLPLALKALGGLLRNKVDLDKWENVLNSKMWREEKSGIIPALRLSYYHLPPHLKQCFAYCSILPEDYEFKEEELVRLWMAIGLVQQESQRKPMEDVGSGYFHDLLSRSFFQPSSINKSQFVMHDLMKELAQWVAGKTCFRLEGQKHGEIFEKARHSSYVGSRYDGFKKFEAFHEVKSLRTFLLLKTSSYDACLTHYVPLKLLPELKFLRVVSLRNYYITELPESLGDLKHLRYLDFSGTDIRSLPESISTLYNLETLMLEGCSRLNKLPAAMGNLINLRLLDITNAILIKEMPSRVGKLTSLQKLSNFIVGDNCGSRIRELMNLKHLRGRLCISRLENVTNAQDARVANLKDKQDLDVLTLAWTSEFEDSRNEGAENKVLEMLRPHDKKLKELTIKCYGGRTIPTWVGDPSFSNMVLLRLENCVKCISLPSLGQLPLLKHLSIQGMNGVTAVGVEFNGKGWAKPFPSLEKLSFEDMAEWKDWFPCGVDGHVELFPRLIKLSIRRCPKLQGKLPSHLALLEKLIIKECEQLVVSIPSLPKLRELEIRGCQEVLRRSADSLRALKAIVVSGISKFGYLREGFLQGLTTVEKLEISGCSELTSLWQKEVGLLQNLNSLHHLKIENCPKFASLVAEEEEEEQQKQGMALRLESLEIVSCKNLETLLGLHSLTSLRELTIAKCRRLVCFPETGFPSMLRELRIIGCSAEGPIFHSSDYASLESLDIYSCESLTLLSSRARGRGELPASLKSLDISDCPKLECVAERLHNNTSLEDLSIEGCESLTSLSSKARTGGRGELPASLKHLDISDCLKLESMAERLHNNTSLERIEIRNCESLQSLPDGLHNLNRLSRFSIQRCPNLVSFPDGGLSAAANLSLLNIRNCIKLDALPWGLASVQSLWISECPGMVSIPKDLGFLTNLTSLVLDWETNVKMWESLIEWGLHRLTSLRRLCINAEGDGGCSDMVSFPEEEKGMILPTSLEELSLVNLKNLENLSYTGFQNLTSLEELWISDCPKLKSFPEEGLPPSLLRLFIWSCHEELKQRCKRDGGRDWRKIAHIPRVRIDGRFVYDEREE